MGLEIFWTNFAKKELQNIYSFYRKKAGANIAKQIALRILSEPERLKLHPNQGQEEQLLSEREQNFRYLIHKHFKIIYWVNKAENRIEITDVFDTRQNPIKIKR